MALFITVSEDIAYTVSGSVFVLPDVTIWNSNTPTIGELTPASATSLRVDGTVLCVFNHAISLFASTSSVADTLVVGAFGGVHAAPPFSAIYMSGAGARVINDGQISGGNGIFLESALFGGIANTGTITGLDFAAIRFLGSNSVQIVNDGTLRGRNGIELIDSYATILNAGRIVATDGTGYAINAASGNGSTVIRNTGQIEAQQIAILGGETTETVVNLGDILGDVLLAGSDDTFRGRQGLIEGTIYGGVGNDFVASGRGDDMILGDDGNDTLRGCLGEDTLYGGRGLDVLRGDEGDDLLYGGNGRDTFVFNRHADDDRIADFANGFDMIDVSAFHLTNFAALSALAVDRAGGLLIDLASLRGGTVFVDGFIKANFDAGDVIL